MNDARPICDDEFARLFAGLERTPLALAVSGGADSVALMHMAARWAARAEVRALWRSTAAGRAGGGARLTPPPPWHRDADTSSARGGGSGTEPGRPHVVVLTVDHGLRPHAAAEAALVAREAAALGLLCAILRWEGAKPVTGVQAAAREARRRLLVDAVLAERDWLAASPPAEGEDAPPPCRSLVMAQHRDDQAETVLMRLARGSGLDGLGGMRPRDAIARSGADAGAAADAVPLLRPLLDQPKTRLVATLETLGVRWIEDPSNDDERFERVRIRRLLRQLEGVGLTADMIALSARRLRDAEADLRKLFAATAAAGAIRWHAGLMADLERAGAAFAGPYVLARTLRQVLDAFGGAAPRPELAEVERLVAASARANCGGATLGGCRIEFIGAGGDGGRSIRVYREGAGVGLTETPVAPGETVAWDGGRYLVTASPTARPGALVRALGMAGWAELKAQVPQLGHLAWPAAAAATLPVIARADRTVAVVGVAAALRAPGVQGRVRDAFEALAAGELATFAARFAGPRDW